MNRSIYSPNELAVRSQVIDVARQQLNSEANTGFSREKWLRAATSGLVGLPLPAHFGGSGKNYLECAAAMEGLGYACDDNGFTFALATHLWACAVPILRFGTAEQRQRYLPMLANGSGIGSLAMTEAGAGSDTSAIDTRARWTGEEYVLTGAKTFITNAPVANTFIVFAKVADQSDLTTAFILERSDPGLIIGPTLRTIGLKGCPISEITLDSCKVPPTRILGEVGAGNLVFGVCMELERTYTIAVCLGTLRRLLETTITRVKHRRQFGQPIARFQGISDRLADTYVVLELATLLLVRIASLHNDGKRAYAESAMLKLTTSEALVKAAQDLLHVSGAAGYLAEGGPANALSDALASRIYSGTSDIQRKIIARHLGL